jgi:hypothetical protein
MVPHNALAADMRGKGNPGCGKYRNSLLMTLKCGESREIFSKQLTNYYAKMGGNGGCGEVHRTSRYGLRCSNGANGQRVVSA